MFLHLESGAQAAVTPQRRVWSAPARVPCLDVYVPWTYIGFMARANTSVEKSRERGERLGFRVDAKTKSLVERAVRLERRTLTDFCLMALTDAARRTLERHESLVLSSVDREAFFDALVHPAAPNARLKRAVRAERKRIER